ncbi:hypothetical protein BJAS_P3169 [Bathymodiolus japonicus methanotrophic gill symbiont]|uniref:DUF433 domain-containing protein n=1 Tax=Bathymodiolus japonicus methanotrophic gill symbiont TaxID=113269 RepID=UPI001B773D4D|nr:DUF433 domain-containing protein [Bathymodiolus japonicus methanotrophic gill symbiont]GFO72710.1 hypothetical protein BJAS_P3169 [Bathymodiolus japonicus methanotrophic gill symbiont]
MKPKKISYLDGIITIDPDLCNGKPTIRGKRITVQTVVEFLSMGETEEEILKQYPTLESNDIHACLVFASKMMGHRYTLQEIA